VATVVAPAAATGVPTVREARISQCRTVLLLVGACLLHALNAKRTAAPAAETAT
jgi:hypothetical protein